MHSAGVGRAMLAYLPEKYLTGHIFKGSLKRFTENTITTRREAAPPTVAGEPLACARKLSARLGYMSG